MAYGTGSNLYTWKQGDTWQGVAQRYGTRPYAVARMNRGIRRARAGTRIRTPRRPRTGYEDYASRYQGGRSGYSTAGSGFGGSTAGQGFARSAAGQGFQPRGSTAGGGIGGAAPRYAQRTDEQFQAPAHWQAGAAHPYKTEGYSEEEILYKEQQRLSGMGIPVPQEDAAVTGTIADIMNYYQFNQSTRKWEVKPEYRAGAGGGGGGGTPPKGPAGRRWYGGGGGTAQYPSRGISSYPTLGQAASVTPSGRYYNPNYIGLINWRI